LTAVIELGDSLKPLQATPGYSKEGRRFTWDNSNVEPDFILHYVIQCECRGAPSNTGFRGTVSDSTGQQKSLEAYLSVVANTEPAPPETPPEQPATVPSLKLTLSSKSNPVRQGDTFTYQVFVTNESNTEDRSINLAVAFPPELTPLRWQTIPSPQNIVDNKVLFAPIASLKGREQHEFSIRVKADKAISQCEIRAAVASENCPDGVQSSGFLDVVQP
jgi:hypothetical protein